MRDNDFFIKMANPGLFLFIFVLFEHNFYRNTVGFSGIRTRFVGVEGEYADPLTTTTAQENENLPIGSPTL